MVVRLVLLFLVCGFAAEDASSLLVADVQPTAEQRSRLDELDQQMQQGQSKDALRGYIELAEKNPHCSEILMEAATAFGQANMLGRAAQTFYLASKLEHPNRAAVFFNLGFTLEQQGKVDKARNFYVKCVDADPSFAQAYIKLASIHRQKGEQNQVVHWLEKAVVLMPKDPRPLLYLGDTLNNMKQWDKAVETYQKAVTLSPKDVQAHIHLGDTLINLNKLKEALKEYETAVALSGGIFSSPVEALVGLLDARRNLAQWGPTWDSLVETVMKRTRAALAEGKPSPLSPYSTFFHATPPDLQLKIAQSWATQIKDMVARAHAQTEPLYKLAGKKDPSQKKTWASVGYTKTKEDSRIKIGYISRRFERYPGTQLMLRVFGLHDRSEFKVFSYAHGPPDGSMERETVAKDSDVFREIYNLPSLEAAKVVAADQLDILIDYDGFHNFNNLEVLALRPAPIQITYLGFAGTTGADFVDYILTDEIITPPDHAKYFSEKLLYHPGTYQPQDHLKIKGITLAGQPGGPSRGHHNLPQNAFVFACFNRVHKIDPDVWNVWMQILKRVPSGVLWLYHSHDGSVEALQQAAEEAGVDASRLIFGGKVSKEEHLARLSLADVTLDTLHYGAHTTASDSLWVGVPVITRPGLTFSSRVAASLVSAAGEPETAVSSFEEYVELAVDLVSNQTRLTELKKRLADVRFSATESSPFFDTPRYVRDLESGYKLVHNALSQTDRANRIFRIVSTGATRIEASSENVEQTGEDDEVMHIEF